MDRFARTKRPPKRSLHAAGRTLVLATALATALAACGAPAPLPPGYAIVYGVSDYESISDLAQPDDDAVAIAAMLAEEGYTIVSGGPRLNEDATRANLVADFAALEATAEPDSRFVFYFAGHGFGDGMTKNYDDPPFSQEWAEHLAESTAAEPAGAGPYPEYLFLYAADPFNDVPLTLQESISDDELADLLAEVPSRRRVVIIDACHSGGFVGSGTSVDTVPPGYEGYGEGTALVDALDAMTLYLTYDSSHASDVTESDAIVMSAAGEQDLSYEGELWGFPNGVFTHFFLQAREAADHNYDGFVTASEAHAYASAAIAAVANDELSGEDKFVPRVSGGAVDYVLFEAR